MTSSPFHSGELDAQRRWGDPELWTEARIGQLIWDRIPEPIHPRIEAAPFFFLATCSPDGRCDCSFKGGGPGLVKVLSPNRLAFPHFEARVKGNGAYMSLGNILLNPQISLLFIDFADGARLRVNGRASIHENAEMMASFPQAECVVAVDIELVVPSCSSYVPHLVPAEPSAKTGK
ncbi:MAG: pyridoxamine 5'-phosphate oxidase [Gallionellales bacterium RIFCSPLOWO2_12_FULL_59_22]|nr:MAG: pyridoxamine 5'-phosphate oxidase [Betaproteobacteria bacterium RIFCSPLOWO2_02_64_14]OGS99911.1 MAG: pyridoxamine 5'-phosphate oxidase [Gallionellales bacterium RIFCSPLOWO2_02_FULL_59_110]OGT12882.1 MAG: pyridoxamine 5'-phosphate oxidase [Gallionellales bacterium RIFCSPLOWO2_12_FULL_59_22]